MAEYILREAFAAEMKSRQDAAHEWLIEATGTDDADGKARAEAILSFLCEVKLTLYAIPAADVVPVRHGRWEPLTMSTDNGMEVLWVHAKCGCERYEKSNFCPNCGARMDGGA